MKCFGMLGLVEVSPGLNRRMMMVDQMGVLRSLARIARQISCSLCWVGKVAGGLHTYDPASYDNSGCRT